MKKYNSIVKDFPHFLHGGDYNPEQWIDTPEIWDQDMKLMKEANCNEMTVGIFSWAELEKEEGVFDFTWLDTIVDKIHANGGKFILATPSGARPHWMADKYPEVLRTAENGVRNEFGVRHNHCYTSPVYREKVRIINEKLAERYAHHPALAAWHLSNEYSGACYCDLCKAEFRRRLQEKYGTIEALNRAWWNRFWSHTLDNFEQINPPKATGGEQTSMGLNLDWRRFISDRTVDFAKAEADAIRKYSDKPITTNCMCDFAGYDHRKMAKVLDVYSDDSYTTFGVHGILPNAKRHTFLNALYRGMKDGKPFMIMESAPGTNNGGMKFYNVKTSAQQLLEAIMFVSGGADTVQYFQWRKARGSYEKFHGAVVDHYGKSDTRVFQAVKKNGEVLKKLDGVIGTGIQSDIAIVYDYETRWAADGGTGFIWGSENLGHSGMTKEFFNFTFEQNISADVIGYDADFSKYKVICLPVPYLMYEKNAQKIKEYVQNGGIVVSTYMTAVVNENDLCYLGGVPGADLKEMFGLRVDEVDNYGCEYTSNSVLYNNKEYPVDGMAELIVPQGAEILATYTGYDKADTPAVLKNKFGKGTCYYIAFQPNEEKSGNRFMHDFMAQIARDAGILPCTEIKAEKDVYITKREGDGEEYYFIMNFSEQENKVALDKTYYSLLEDKQIKGEVVLPPCGVMVLTN